MNYRLWRNREGGSNDIIPPVQVKISPLFPVYSGQFMKDLMKIRRNNVYKSVIINLVGALAFGIEPTYTASSFVVAAMEMAA